MVDILKELSFALGEKHQHTNNLSESHWFSPHHRDEYRQLIRDCYTPNASACDNGNLANLILTDNKGQLGLDVNLKIGNLRLGFNTASGDKVEELGKALAEHKTREAAELAQKIGRDGINASKELNEANAVASNLAHRRGFEPEQVEVRGNAVEIVERSRYGETITEVGLTQPEILAPPAVPLSWGEPSVYADAYNGGFILSFSEGSNPLNFHFPFYSGRHRR